MNLNTGRVIVRQHFTVVPVTQEVIKQVEQLGNLDNKYRQALQEDEQNLEDELNKDGDEIKDKEQDNFDEEQALELDEDIEVNEDNSGTKKMREKTLNRSTKSTLLHPYQSNQS